MEAPAPLADLLSRAAVLSDTDLHTLLELLREDLKDRMKRARTAAAEALCVGDDVAITVPGRLPVGAVGHISAIRRGLVTVHFPEQGFWKVDATSLRKVVAVPGSRTPL